MSLGSWEMVGAGVLCLQELLAPGHRCPAALLQASGTTEFLFLTLFKKSSQINKYWVRPKCPLALCPALPVSSYGWGQLLGRKRDGEGGLWE